MEINKKKTTEVVRIQSWTTLLLQHEVKEFVYKTKCSFSLQKRFFANWNENGTSDICHGSERLFFGGQ